MIVIADSSIIIAFIKKDDLHLLKELFATIHVPTSVSDELTQGAGSNLAQLEKFQEAIRDGWIIIDPAIKPTISDLPLGKAEAEAINSCVSNPQSFTLLMDEKKGRKIARMHGINVLGTVGILAYAFKKKIQEKEKSITNLKTLLSAGFYLSSDVVLAFIAELNNPDSS